MPDDLELRVKALYDYLDALAANPTQPAPNNFTADEQWFLDYARHIRGINDGIIDNLPHRTTDEPQQ